MKKSSTFCGGAARRPSNSWKAYFDAALTGIGSIEECQEWTCPLADGRVVLVVMDEEYVRVFCDRKDAFLSLECFRQNLDTDRNLVTLTKENIETLVSCLDFFVVPQKPDMAWAKDALQALPKGQNSYESPFPRDYQSYADVVRTILKNGAPQGYGYVLRDITGDGEAELLLGVEGSFSTVKNLVEGKPVTLWSNGMVQGLELCLGDVLRWVSENHVAYLKWDEITGQLETFLELGYDPWEESWYRKENGVQETISRTEYNSLLEAYPLAEPDWEPVESYPIE